MRNLPPPALKKVWRQTLVLFAVTFLAGCANYDFGEVHPVLVTDGIHDWLGRDSGGPNRSLLRALNTLTTSALCAISPIR